MAYAYAYNDETNKNPEVQFDSYPMIRCPIRCPSSSCYTSSCSSSSRSSLDEPYDIDKADGDLSPEAKQPDLIEPPTPVPSPEVTEQTNVWSSGSSAQSPQILLANGKPSGYDPSRLPPDMFAAKPSSAMDWSVASNESLFSIHVGNSSFSTDQHFVNLNKSGELEKIDEMYLNVPTQLSPVSEALETDPSSNAVVKTVEIDNHSGETESVETRSEISKEENIDINIVTGNVEKDEETKDTVMMMPITEETMGSTFSHRSNESTHSSQSFQFPVLADQYDDHDHHEHVKHPLEQVREENKQAMRAPEKQQYQPQPKRHERNAPSKATESSNWLSCITCCWICR